MEKEKREGKGEGKGEEKGGKIGEKMHRAGDSLPSVHTYREASSSLNYFVLNNLQV